MATTDVTAGRNSDCRFLPSVEPTLVLPRRCGVDLGRPREVVSGFIPGVYTD